MKAILTDIDSHVGEGNQGDDMTIVAMAIDQRRAKRKSTTLPGVPPSTVDRGGVTHDDQADG